MSFPALRVGDPGAHGGAVSAGAATVTVAGLPAARVGDPHSEPPPLAAHGPQVIARGSATVFIEGRPAAREGDLLGCGAVLSATQATVLIGG
ncbi:PAAR domain-containing protein [Deinococcus gobiensis]|uniref:PAAR domain-containing protein n=1 Tax=Deinococcus gobiensis TaxID=502394 RepID=UPI0005C1811C|nr:PAAR domain-containing protein [Deinococcus gobiensis]